MFPIAMHWNPLANGTMILNAMMWSPEGVAGVQVGTLNPYATAPLLLCVFVMFEQVQLQRLGADV
jgi:hypothetical protein